VQAVVAEIMTENEILKIILPQAERKTFLVICTKKEQRKS